MSIDETPAKLRPSSEAKRAAIVEAAAQAFFRNGYEATSIEAVAEEAGVSKVTIYNHFGDKRALFAAAVDCQCARLQSVLKTVPVGSGPIRDRLMTIGETFVAFLARPEMIQFDRRVAAETSHTPEIGTSFLDAGPRRMHAGLAAIIEQAVEAGELAVDDSMLAAEQFASMCKGFGDLERRYEAGSDPARDSARIEGAVDVFLSAYGT